LQDETKLLTQHRRHEGKVAMLQTATAGLGCRRQP
jgi:hypothetical protein